LADSCFRFLTINAPGLPLRSWKRLLQIIPTCFSTMAGHPTLCHSEVERPCGLWSSAARALEDEDRPCSTQPCAAGLSLLGSLGIRDKTKSKCSFGHWQMKNGSCNSFFLLFSVNYHSLNYFTLRSHFHWKRLWKKVIYKWFACCWLISSIPNRFLARLLLFILLPLAAAFQRARCLQFLPARSSKHTMMIYCVYVYSIYTSWKDNV